MTPTPGESIESWATRVQSYEYGRALMLLSAGRDPIVVMEETSRRILGKLEHYVIHKLRETIAVREPQDLGLAHYVQNYKKRIAPRADHIKED